MANNFIKKINYKGINHPINSLMYLACLGLAQIIKGTMVVAFPHFLAYYFSFSFFGSTIQGSLSDIYKRSTILNIALVILVLSLLGLVGAYFFQGFFISPLLIGSIIIIIGIGGNADVVSRASLIDIHYKMNRRKLMAWTVFAEAFSWVVIGVLIRFFNFNPFNVLTLCLPIALILLITSLLLNIDKTEDKKYLHDMKTEFKIVIREQWRKLIVISILIIIGELGYFFFFYSQENYIQKTKILADSYIAWFIGMSLGAWILSKFKNHSDFRFLLLGFVISVLSIILFMCNGMKSIVDPNVFYYDSFVYGLAGFGSGVYLPCFYSMISKGHSIHFQGILTGWVDSLRILGDAISNIFLPIMVIFSFFIPIYLSGVLFIFSILFFVFYRKKICL